MPDSIDKTGRSRKQPRRISGAGKSGASQPNTPTENSEGAGEVSFRDVLTGVTGGSAEKRLGGILGEIKELAHVLAHRRLLEDLEKYREKVGEFLKLYMDEVLSLRETSGRRGFSRRKQLLVVKKVNVELEELSRFVLGNEPDFKILQELGTIEGLLMDLYS